MKPLIDLGAELLSTVEADVIGLAVVAADRTIQCKVGRLVDWLPQIGEDCCQCVLLVGMEAELAALAEGKRSIIALSGVRGASFGLDYPVTAAVLWNSERAHYNIVVVPDFAARQVEVLLGTERRARRVMEQQLEAASSEVRFASFARTRLRLARDLHDTLAHSIVALLIQIRMIRHFLSTDLVRVSDGLATAEEAAISGLARVRDAIARLRMPDELEIAPDVDGMLSDFAERTGIKVSVHIGEEVRDGLRAHGVTVQRILAEALHNIEVHAKARHVRFHAVEMEMANSKKLVVEIGDDGSGFDPTAPKPGHFGLVGMAEFAELVGGQCVVESSPEEGTLVRLSLPAIAAQSESSSSMLSGAGCGLAGSKG